MNTVQIGAFGFGAVIGWYLYYINRYRGDSIGLSDLAAVIGAIGGAGVLALFPAGTELFGWYGIGLAGGFFAYFLFLVIAVLVSRRFTVEFFLDGRVPKRTDDEQDSGQKPLGSSSMGERGPR